jgi:hypothetical protein
VLKVNLLIPYYALLITSIGDNRGSVKIDEGFQDLVRSRLSHLNLQQDEVHRIVDEMNVRFQGVKHDMGIQSITLLQDITIAIPELRRDNDEEAKVKGGKMIFTQ